MPTDDLPTEADAEAIDARPTTATAVSLNDASVRAGDLADRGLSAYVSPSTRIPAAELRAPSPVSPEPAPRSQYSPPPEPNAPVLPEIPAEANLVDGLPPAPSAQPGSGNGSAAGAASGASGASDGPSIPGLDPVADAQAAYAAARLRAAESMQGLNAQFARFGFAAPPPDALADPAALHDYAQARINRALASPAANEEAPFGPARLSPNADRIRKNLTVLGDRAASAIRDHAHALSNLRSSYSELQQTQQAQSLAGQPQAQAVSEIPGLDTSSSSSFSSSSSSPAGTNAAPGEEAADAPVAAPKRGDSVGFTAGPDITTAAPHSTATAASASAAAQQPGVSPGATAASLEEAILKPSAEQQWTAQSIADAKAGKRSYAITADNQFSLSESAPLQSMTEAVKDGVLPSPPAEVWKAIVDKQALIDAAGSNPKIKAALAGAGRGAAFLATAPVGAGIGGAALSETGPGAGIDALIGGLITGTAGAWAYGKLVKELAKHNDTIHSFVASQELHPGYAAAGEFAAFGAGLPRAAMRATGEGLGRLADSLASKSAVPGETADAVRAAMSVSDIARAAGMKAVGPAVEADAYARASNALSAIGKSYSSGGGGLLQSIENFQSIAKTAAANNDSAGVIAATIAKRVATGAAGMVVIDTVIKEGSRALGLSDEGQTLSGAAQALLLGAMASGHGIHLQGYDHEQLGNILLRGLSHDVTGTAYGEKVDLSRLAQTRGIGTGVNEAMTHPLTPEEQEIFSAFNQKATKLISEGRISADPAQWQTRAEQILMAGRKAGIAHVEIQNKPESVPGRVVGDETPAREGVHPASQSPAEVSEPVSNAGASPPANITTPAAGAPSEARAETTPPEAEAMPAAPSSSASMPDVETPGAASGESNAPAPEATREKPSIPGMPDLPEGEHGWGEVAGSRPGQLVETRDGQRGTLAGTTGTRAFIKPAEGGSVIRAPLNDVRISQQPIEGATNPTPRPAAEIQKEVSRGAVLGGPSLSANEPGSWGQGAPVPGEGEGHVPPPGIPPEEETSSRSKPAKPAPGGTLTDWIDRRVPDISKDDAASHRAERTYGEIAQQAQGALRPEYQRAVAEDGRNGYPGVPGLRPAAGLTNEQRIIEAHFAQLIAQDPQGMLERYRQLAEKDFGTPDYYSTDLARKMYPPYAGDRRARLVLEPSTTGPAGYLAMKLGMDAQLKAPRTPDKPYGVLLAGAPGSGKTTSVKSLLKPDLQHSAVIVEGIMARYEPAKARLEQFIAAGLQPEVVFVYRPFESASRDVITRTAKSGRPIALANMGVTHYQSQEVFFRLAEEFEGRADFKVLFNDGKVENIKERSLDELWKKTYSNIDEKDRESSDKRGEGRSQESLLRTQDEGGTGGTPEAIHREPEEGRGGLAARSSERGTAGSRLGRAGTAEERQAALTEYHAQQLNDAYRAGTINTAEYRALRYGHAVQRGAKQKP
jgi:hypothetical protein